MAEQTARIVLGQLAGGSARIVLGDAGEAPAQPEVLVAGNAAFPALGVRTGLLRYSSAAQRPIVGQAHTPWQVASTREPHGVAAGHRDAPARPTGWAGRWQDAAPLHSSFAHPLPKVLRKAWLHLHGIYQGARHLSTGAAIAQQDALRVRIDRRSSYQDAHPVERVTGFAHQDGIKTHRHIGAWWQVAAALGILRGTSYQKGGGCVLRFGGRYQEGVPPPPGISPRPPEPPGPGPCYDPALLARIVLDGAAAIDAHIVLVCYLGGTGPETIVLPIKRTYIVINNITLTRVSDGAPLHALSFSASLDFGSWTWQWSATLHESAEAHLGRNPDGTPPEVLASINGVPLRLCLERIQLQEQFLPQKRFSVSGRGRSAILSSPWAPVLQHGGQPTARTAQQLANEVLAINGVPIGWDVDWGIDDWTVPPGVWTHSGSYIDALTDIAGSVGAYLQPHNTDPIMRVLAKYPVSPWEWATLVPDYVLPREAVQTVGTEYIDKPAYNGIYVGGVQAGVFGPVTRSGTVGDLQAPTATHALITDATAHRMRGIAELSDTGKQRRVSLSLQVHPTTGLILPGKMVQVGSGTGGILGIVRGTSVEWGSPRLRQNIELEVHE